MTKTEFYDRYKTKVKSLAYRLAVGNPGIDADDIEQEIWLKVYDRSDSQFASLTALEASSVERMLFIIGNNYCATERYYYTLNCAEYIYTPADVRALLEESFFNPVHWEDGPVKEKEISITAGGVVVSLWDLDNAFDSLNADEQVVLRKRYEFGCEYDDNAERMRCNRTVDKMTRNLNRSIDLRKKDAA